MQSQTDITPGIAVASTMAVWNHTPHGISVAEIRHLTSADRPVPCGLFEITSDTTPGREDAREITAIGIVATARRPRAKRSATKPSADASCLEERDQAEGKTSVDSSATSVAHNTAERREHDPEADARALDQQACRDRGVEMPSRASAPVALASAVLF